MLTVYGSHSCAGDVAVMKQTEDLPHGADAVVDGTVHVMMRILTIPLRCDKSNRRMKQGFSVCA